MTSVIFKRRGRVYEICVDGHAGYGPGGNDVVCAACSVLTCTLMECAAQMDADGVLRSLVSERTGGHAVVKMQAEQSGAGRVYSMVDTIRTGFQLLAEQYPKHVNVKIGRESF